MRRKPYMPTETHIALHPQRTIVTCANPDCVVKFAQRPESDHGEDDPTLCLTCNRKVWSRLWNGNRPVELQEMAEHGAQTVDSSIADVLPLLRKAKS